LSQAALGFFQMAALLAVVARSLLILGFSIGGQILIETVFSCPGMGKAVVKAVLAHEHPVAQAAFFLMVSMVIGLKFPTDLSDSRLELCIRPGTT
jgi:peptide/nickel transport system permease protein